MRNIKFRGKNLKTGQWVYGFYVHLMDSFRKRETHRIYTGLADSMPDSEGYDFSEDCEDVDPKTVGQFTGLEDINGKEVYEGDIVRYRLTDERYKKNPRFTNLPVAYDESQARFEAGNIYWDILRSGKIEVIGNIYDNHGLLERKD